MRVRKSQLLGVVTLLGLAGCSDQAEDRAGAGIQPADDQYASPVKRWYDEERVAKGYTLFQANCATCHKPDASGTTNWRELDANGQLPPPPLNGTAHTWHHPLSVLRRTVRVGGVPLGGTMPGFAEKLNTREIDDILAWVQSHWPDRIYDIWSERDAQAGKIMKHSKKG